MPLSDNRLADRPQLEDILLDAVTANATGSWKPGQRRYPTHITIEGIGGAFTATVTIYGSLQHQKPTDGDTAGRPVLVATASAGMSFIVEAPYAWYTAVVTNYVGGTIFSGLVAG